MSKLSTDFSSVLRCPVTGSVLEQSGDSLISVATGAKGERYSYPIIEGIPLLLAQEATLIPADAGMLPSKS